MIPGLLAGAWLICGTSLAAQDPAPLKLTLRDALHRALEQNPQIHQSLLNLAMSQEDTRAARSALLPTLDAAAFGQRNKANFDTFTGGHVPGAPVPDVVGPYSWGQIGIQGRATLFDLSLFNRWRASRASESAAQAQVRTMREGITALTVGQYLRALRASEATKASQSRVELAQALEKLAEDQQTHGVGTKLDTLRAQVQLQNERQRLIQAQTQLKTSLFGLAKLLDLAPGTPIELMDRLAAPALPQFNFQEAYKAGLDGRPELTALESRERAAGYLKDAAQNLRLPSVVFTGSFVSTGVSPGEPWIPVYQLGLGVKVPLFTGGLVAARIAKAKLELGKIEDERREIKSQVSLELQVAQAEWEAARGETDVTSQTVSFAAEALQQARHRFEAGVSNNIELINAQDELARANDSQINALYRLNQARADLAKAMGRMQSYFSGN
ncbi:MAG: TolC family protein [Acidobacteriota bacterium]|nr:TolC family protein [Acidobacteriota bacterium]